MFLKSAMSLLTIEGLRTKFLVKLPMSPALFGLPKQAGLSAYANPVASLAPTFLFGSQSRTVRAFMSPPVKSVMPVHEHVVVEPGVSKNPGAQGCPVARYVCPVLIVYEAPLNDALTPFGLPLAYDVVPEICQLSNKSLTILLSQ